MCSCSGSCNCNSTTIPKGPAGPIGPQGIQGVAGFNGFDGTNGKNAFTTLKENFQQPASSDNDSLPTTIKVVDAAWIAIGQIIFIGKTISSLAGGYYRVLDKNINGDLNAINVMRLSWVNPNESFVVNPNSVLIGSPITPAGTKGIDGIDGTGTPGIPGINAFSAIPNGFVQPDFNILYTINSVNNTAWIGLGQIVYITSSSLSSIGGFYQVQSKTANSVSVKRLDWTIPNVTFVTAGNPVSLNSYMIPSGSKGADGSTGLSYLQEAKWGSFGASTSGLNVLKTSIAVPGGTLVENEDVLECQTILIVGSLIPVGNYPFTISVGLSQSATDSDAVSFTIPFLTPSDPEYAYMVNINYKIQKTAAAGYRSKGECFVSSIRSVPTIAPLLYKQAITQSFLCNSTGSISLTGGSWINEQYVSVIVNDPNGDIAVTHHEVKVVKIKV